MQSPTYKQILPYIEKGLVKERSHPCNPAIKIFCYTEECVYSKAWDDITLECRGLILNTLTDEVMARPFRKFFNWGELSEDEQSLLSKDKHYSVEEKLDGSLGILYWYNDKPCIATKGSFDSDQSVWATEWFRQNINYSYMPGRTELFEIIYPENRIVVNYPESGLSHLATIQKDTGNTVISEPIVGCKTRALCDVLPIDALCKQDKDNAEGYVLYFHETGTRVKVKFPNYVEKHMHVTGLSTKMIWRAMCKYDGELMNVRVVDILHDIPDELHDWADSVVKDICMDYYVVLKTVISELAPHEKVMATKSRKDIAEVVMSTTYPGLGFMWVDLKAKQLDKQIMRTIEPHGSKTFKY